MEQVNDLIDEKQEVDPEQSIPNLELPKPAPEQCNGDHTVTMKCKKCKETQTWWGKFRSTVDELLFKLNKHKCYSGCTNSQFGTCKAQFPRDTFLETSVDPETGALNMKEGEAWLNTFTPVLTYLMHCNTDVRKHRTHTRDTR